MKNRRFFLIIVLIVLTIGSLISIKIIAGNFSMALSKTITGLAGLFVTGKASSMSFNVGICINNPPVIINTTCPLSIGENETLNCSFQGYDMDNQTFNFSSLFITNITLFEVNESGYVYKDGFSYSQIGNHSYNVIILDNSSCSNNFNTYNYDIEVLNMINHAPECNKSVLGYTWVSNNLYSYSPGYDIDSLCWDFDEDILNYTFYTSPPTNPIVDINVNFSTGKIIYTPKQGVTGSMTITYRARDPEGLNDITNSILLRIQQEDSPEEPEEPEKSEKFPNTYPIPGANILLCMPSWECGNWSECLPQGYQIRECMDNDNCNTSLFKPNTTQECNYTPTCYDGVKNGDEEGVDCGGSCPDKCPSAATCYDGIKNGDEEGVDCGGSCPNECLSIATCYDGIKNQDEEGIDCGGACDKKCPIEEKPSSFFIINWLRLLFILFMITGIYGGLQYIYLKKKHLLHFLHKLRKILHRGSLLTIDKKRKLLNQLDKLELDLPKTRPQIAISKVSKIITEYFIILLKTKKGITNMEMIEFIKSSDICDELKNISISLYDDINIIEFSTNKLSNSLVNEIIYEIRNFIYAASNLKISAKLVPLSNIKAKNQEDMFFRLIRDININLFNNQFEDVMKHYNKMHELILSKEIRNKFIINMLKRIRGMYHYKNAKNN